MAPNDQTTTTSSPAGSMDSPDPQTKKLSSRQRLIRAVLLNATLFFILSITAGVALSVVALSLDNVLYVNDQLRDSSHFYVQVGTWNSTGGWTGYVPGIMSYPHDNLEMGTMYAALASGVLAFAGCVALIVLWTLKLRSSKPEMEGMQKYTWIPSTTLALSSLTAILVLACTLYAAPLFHRRRPLVGEPLISEFDPPLSGWDTDVVSSYIGLQHVSVLDWNCGLARVLAYVTPAGNLRRMCREGLAIFDVMIPMVILQGLVVPLLGLILWRERSGRKVALATSPTGN